MPGSSLSVSGPNFILNTAVAEFLCRFADELEGKDNFEDALMAILRRTIQEHKRIIFNGNNYSEEWVQEAARRGLSNRKSAPEAMLALIEEKNQQLLCKHHILTPDEAHSRYEINLDNYSKVINIEALTMLEMVRRDILPAVSGYVQTLSETLVSKKQACPAAAGDMEETLIIKLSDLCSKLFCEAESLEKKVAHAKGVADKQAQAEAYRDTVLPSMAAMRALADEMETYTPKDVWPMPTYGDLLFSIQ